MTGTLACLATLVTIAVLVTYEVVLIVAQRWQTDRMARSTHAACYLADTRYVTGAAGQVK